MNINIGQFNITSDDKNITVHERYTKKDGGEGLKFVGYHSTIQAALRSLLNAVMKRSDATDINSLLDAIDKHQKDIEQLIKDGVTA